LDHRKDRRVLAAADVAGYLLDQKLLSPWAVVHGGLRVVDTSRLNRVFVVTTEGGPCFVLKAADGRGAAVVREAAALERLSSVDRMASSLPRLIAYDERENVLILESARDARDLVRHHARGRFSCALASEAGRALALLHAIPPAALDGLPPAPHPVPTAELHRPDLATLQTLSAGAVELIRVIQGIDELCAVLDELGGDGPEESVIHGDIRWDNCLAVRGGAAHGWRRLQLIDWEDCAAGDPSFDIGGFLGEYLLAWLRSIPIADPRDPGRLLAHARIPLQRMRPAVWSFWEAYVRHSRTTAACLGARLYRATRFAALRLLTAALEEAQARAELPAFVLPLLPLSQNILGRPTETARLLGLSLPHATA
jgi:aminoglycoside phosphotransferase (APT) family kinase protein